MSPLANQDPLLQLNGIIEPSAASAFPFAPINWILLLTAIVAVFICRYFLKKYLNQQQLQKTFLKQLEQSQQQKLSFIELNQLLKVAALHYFPRADVASLHGQQWFDFLQQYSDFTIFKNQDDFMQRLYGKHISACEIQDNNEAKRWLTALPKQIKKHNKKRVNNV